MSIFSKQSNAQNAETIGAKRDLTIHIEPKKRPDHIVAETDDAQWKIPLTIEEQCDLSYAYEDLQVPEAQMLEQFRDAVYSSTGVKLSIEVKPVAPGRVRVEVSASTGQGAHGRLSEIKVLSHVDVGEAILRWMLDAQSRRELVADLVAAFPDGQK